ncbi:MAG TPA: hypothetical protein VG838_12215 [Opitutaceae bacterium]|nr:hypothetical protein [Opitutaceae bacterium]
MASLKPSPPRPRRLLLRLAYGASVAIFLAICSQFYVPGKGFTYLERFGTNQSAHALPELRAINHYEEADSDGYDGQQYAQIAMHPWLSNPGLNRAVDSLPYRARRILFSWTAYGLALGDPGRALHIYAVQNIVCWLGLAVLMLRWFPPVNWGNFFRWFGVLFSSGVCLSVRSSLVDGPSLLLIAGGVALAEAGRSWWSALLLGVSGLGKETNILAAAALPRITSDSTAREKLAVLARWTVVLLPIAFWVLLVREWIGAGSNLGLRNFAYPFAGYLTKWAEILRLVRSNGIDSIAEWNLLAMMFALTAQWFFFLLRPRWDDPWWRVGAVFSLLMVVLGDAVWEGYPGATTRVVLPMLLAFNVLVPRGRQLGWWLVLLLGNLTVIFAAVEFLKPPGREDFHLHGPRELIMIEKSGHTVGAVFGDDQWFLPERSHFDYWRWSRGSADLILRNPQPFAVVADIEFDLKSNDERLVTVTAGERRLWSGSTLRTLQHVAVPGVRLEPGDTVWHFATDQPAVFPINGDPRKLAFRLRNLTINVTHKAPALPATAK